MLSLGLSLPCACACALSLSLSLSLSFSLSLSCYLLNKMELYSRAAPGKSGLHARGEGERVLALESREHFI